MSDDSWPQNAPARRVRVTLRDGRSLASLAEALGVSVDDLTEVDATTELAFVDLDFLSIDCETTGLDPNRCAIIELGYAAFTKGRLSAEHSTFCATDVELDEEAQKVTGITPLNLKGAPALEDALPALARAMERSDFIIAYNAPFDRAFLERAFANAQLPFPTTPWIDPLVIVRELDRYKPRKNLDETAKRWGVDRPRSHRALPDAKAAGHLLLQVAPFVPVTTLEELLVHQQAWSERQEEERAQRRAARAARKEQEAAEKEKKPL